jgi:Ran GTPase-activating protein (RanGAP) involved in mRNA processing and transport
MNVFGDITATAGVAAAASLPQADNDLKSLYGHVKALKQNLWDGDEPLHFDGILWSNSMREGAAVLLLNALKLNWTVRTLVLRNTSLDLKASKALSDVFSRSRPLQSISLSKLRFQSHANGIPTILFEIMCLEELALDECTLRAESCAALGRMLRRSKEIRSLTLQNLKLHSMAWITGINHSTSLTTLNLESMDLPPNRVEKLLAVLIDSTTLTNVRLDDMNISDCHFESLSLLIFKNTHLKELSLQTNNLLGATLQWLSCLTENTTLRSLDLSNNPLGDDGARIIIELLQRNSTLQTLGLINCEIQQPGCDWIARGIATFPGLHYLSIDDNAMEGSLRILEASLTYENTQLRRVFNNPPTAQNTLSLDAAALEVWKNIDFYLRLNKANRGCFTAVNARVVTDILPNLLANAAVEPDVLYYCLRIVLPAMANEGN